MKTKDGTQVDNLDTDIDTDVDTQDKPKVLSPREVMMGVVVNDAMDRREEEYLEEGLEPPPRTVALNDDDDEDDIPVEDPEGEPTPEIIPVSDEVVDKPIKSSDTPLVQRDDATFIKVKIDGVDKEVTIDEMVKHYQMNENANTKLGQANQMLAEARNIQRNAASTLSDDSTAQVVDRDALKSAMEKLYDGDVDDATDILAAQLSNTSKQKAPIDISSQVALEVQRISDHKNLEQSYAEFMRNDEFKPLVEDPFLLDRVDKFTEELQNDAEFMATRPSYADIFNEAGKRTQSWLNSKTPAVAPQEPVDERIDRKRSKPASINSRTARRSAPVETPAPTREDTISSIARARGQTVY